MKIDFSYGQKLSKLLKLINYYQNYQIRKNSEKTFIGGNFPRGNFLGGIFPGGGSFQPGTFFLELFRGVLTSHLMKECFCEKSIRLIR